MICPLFMERDRESISASNQCLDRADSWGRLRGSGVLLVAHGLKLFDGKAHQFPRSIKEG